MVPVVDQIYGYRDLKEYKHNLTQVWKWSESHFTKCHPVDISYSDHHQAGDSLIIFLRLLALILCNSD